MKEIISSRLFKFSFFLTLILIFTAAALLLTDYRCRRTVTGDDSALFTVIEKGREVSLAVNALGVQEERDITRLHSLWEKFCDLICIPHD